MARFNSYMSEKLGCPVYEFMDENVTIWRPRRAGLIPKRIWSLSQQLDMIYEGIAYGRSDADDRKYPSMIMSMAKGFSRHDASLSDIASNYGQRINGPDEVIRHAIVKGDLTLEMRVTERAFMRGLYNQVMETLYDRRTWYRGSHFKRMTEDRVGYIVSMKLLGLDGGLADYEE